jgi:hypothetical protein
MDTAEALLKSLRRRRASSPVDHDKHRVVGGGRSDPVKSHRVAVGTDLLKCVQLKEEGTASAEHMKGERDELQSVD